MAAKPLARERPPEDPVITVSRADLLTEGFKALLLVNGGGAVALLAFVQAVITSAPDLARLALTAIAIQSAGLVFALLVPIFRYFHSHAARYVIGDDKRTGFWYAFWACVVLSVCAFLASVLYLVVEGRALIP